MNKTTEREFERKALEKEREFLEKQVRRYPKKQLVEFYAYEVQRRNELEREKNILQNKLDDFKRALNIIRSL